jgi:hypothetical protein
MKKEEEERIVAYVEALEEVNEQLLATLKKCLQMLAHFSPPLEDQDKWQGILDDFEGILKSSERIKMERVLH